MTKFDKTKKFPEECLVNIRRSTDVLYCVGQTYENIENKEYVGIIIQQIVDAIEDICNDLSALIKESEEKWHEKEMYIREEVRELHSELIREKKRNQKSKQ